jgi:DNA-binding PadR family transcriptional regulator
MNRSTKEAALEVLYERAISGKYGDFSLTAPKIQQKSGVSVSPSVVTVFLEELLKEGLIEKPQHGIADRYRITAQGIRFMDAEVNSSRVINSSEWTGVLSNAQIAQVYPLILKIELEAEKITDNETRSQILGIVQAIRILLDIPQPPKSVIVQALRDDAFSNLVQFATLIAAVLAAIRN